MDLALVGVGGVFGGICRFQLGKAISQKFNTSFPIGTFLINISGALLLGILTGADMGNSGYLLFGDGFCGAFTTFSTFMEEHPGVYKRMIAAYVIGYSVTEDYLTENPHLKFAESADDTGVIISYNTQAPEIEGDNLVVSEGALVINPISWTRDETPALASENLGSYLPSADGYVEIGSDTEFKKILIFADARVDRRKGVLVCSTVDADAWFSGNVLMGKGIYHSYDYSFYYYNIRQNAADRVEKFLIHVFRLNPRRYKSSTSVILSQMSSGNFVILANITETRSARRKIHPHR